MTIDSLTMGLLIIKNQSLDNFVFINLKNKEGVEIFKMYVRQSFFCHKKNIVRILNLTLFFTQILKNCTGQYLLFLIELHNYVIREEQCLDILGLLFRDAVCLVSFGREIAARWLELNVYSAFCLVSLTLLSQIHDIVST